MTGNLPGRRMQRIKGTNVRIFHPVQPNPDGGRPTDPLVLALEGDLEGLIACREDRDAILHGLDLLHKYASMQAVLISRLCIKLPTTKDRNLAARLRASISRVDEHLRERVDRLQDAVIPELQRITTLVDNELSNRAAFSALTGRTLS